jgi:hypothetical protein
MDVRTVADVEGWESRPFGGGYDGLHDLARGEFTGCVVAGNTYLFMVRGRVVGVFDYTEPSVGDPTAEPAPIERFEDADGTAHEAPEDALALLYAMVASGGETRGRYYSNDTPLEEVDRTLQDGGFTGYLELSENVLSGDYYLVYHGGRRRSVAFVGQSRRLKGDEDAFDLAADEVGIYEVTAVPLSPVEIPGSPGSGAAVAPDAGPTPTGGDDEPDGTTPDADSESGSGAFGPEDPANEPDAGDTGSGAPDAEGRTADAEGEATATGSEFDIDLDAAMRPRSAGRRAEDERDDGPDELDAGDTAGGAGSVGPTDENDPEPSGGSPTSPFGEVMAEEGDPGDTEGVAPDADTSDDPGVSGPATPDDGEDEIGDDDDATDAAEDDGEPTVRSAVTAVRDDETIGPGEATPEDVEAATAAAEAEIEDEAPTEAEADPAEPASSAAGGGSGSTGAATAAVDLDDARVVPSVDPARTERAPPEAADERVIDGETVAGLRSELSARADRIEELRERLEAVERERDDLRAERDDLAERVSKLEERLAESGAAPLENTRELSAAEALSGTSVLVRYRSKSEPTLAEAHDGRADRDELAANLVLEPHATFDTEDVSVSGRTFGAFLEETQGYGFLRWLVGEFPFEIRDTGNVTSLETLYEALPELDRVEFDAAVTLEGADRETARFDLVGRDRRGSPLLVAHLEDDRAPTNAATMGEFLTDATAAAESHESLVAAFAVTASYFEPEALTTAEDAAGGSLLSRSKRKSFVKTSRKGGYHLCLVEDREESFYLSVPEL